MHQGFVLFHRWTSAIFYMQAWEGGRRFIRKHLEIVNSLDKITKQPKTYLKRCLYIILSIVLMEFSCKEESWVSLIFHMGKKKTESGGLLFGEWHSQKGNKTWPAHTLSLSSSAMWNQARDSKWEGLIVFKAFKKSFLVNSLLLRLGSAVFTFVHMHISKVVTLHLLWATRCTITSNRNVRTQENIFLQLLRNEWRKGYM